LAQARYYDNLVNNYRYDRGGSYNYTSQYGAQMLRDAVNNGYEEDFRPVRQIVRTVGISTIRTHTRIRMRLTDMMVTTSQWTIIAITSAKVFNAGMRMATMANTSTDSTMAARTRSLGRYYRVS